MAAETALGPLPAASGWRAVRTLLAEAGWTLLATGDWSWVYASPDGRRVVRTTPFDPGFDEFLTVCRDLAGNRHIPVIESVIRHPDRSYSVLMERLAHASADEAAEFFGAWAEASPGSDLRLLHDRLHGHTCDVPLFMGPDTNPANVLRRTSGDLVLTDGFWIRGPELYEMVTADPDRAGALFDRGDLARWAYLPCMDADATAAILAALDRPPD